eukprot:symbB.v1.2.000944.t2/scaffold45.1/size390604/7
MSSRWSLQRARLWFQLRSNKEYEMWRLERARRLLYTLPPAALVGVTMMSLHCWEGHISLTGCLSTCCVLFAECFFSGILGSGWSAVPSLSKRFQLGLFLLQELLLMVSALQIEGDSTRQLFYMSTVMPFFLIFSTIGYVPLGLFLGAATWSSFINSVSYFEETAVCRWSFGDDLGLGFCSRTDGKDFFSDPNQAVEGFVHDDTFVINALRREQVVRGVPVAHLDENGHGVVYLHVRKDKETFEFTYPRSLPGEKLNLMVGSAKKDRFKKSEAGRYRLAIDERCSASVHEVTPRCEHFAQKCGGCAFQNLKYGAQLHEKFTLLQMRLKEFNVKPLLPLQPPLASPETRHGWVDVMGGADLEIYGWHARTEFRFFLREGLQLGLHPEGIPIPVPLSRCHLHPEVAHRAFEAILAAARGVSAQAFEERRGNGWLCHLVLRSARPKVESELEVLATLVTVEEAPVKVLKEIARTAMAKEGGEHVVQSPTWRSVGLQGHQLLAGRSFLLHELFDFQVRLSPEGFFRPNLFSTEKVIHQLLEMIGSIGPDEVLWDTFCGQGLLTTRLHPETPKVSVLQADLGVPAFLHRLTAASIGDVTSEGQSIEEDSDVEDGSIDTGNVLPMVESLPSNLPAPSILLADPGRNGMPKAFRRQLLELQVPKLLYISSGRAFLRDVAYLTTKRGYRLKELRCFDLQPHTAKFEVCPMHLACWFLFHGSYSLDFWALGLMQCFGALMIYLLVEEAELENFNVLSKLTFEQKYMETMHSSLQGMLSSIFDASCICNEEGDIRCWAQSPHRHDEALLSSLVNVTSLLDLTLDPSERESLWDFLQRMNARAASCNDPWDQVGTLTLKLKKAVPVEVQLSGIKVPARRTGRRASKTSVELNEESRMLIGLKLSSVTELRSNSKGRAVSDSPNKSRRMTSSENRPGTPQGKCEEPPVLRLPSKSRSKNDEREKCEKPVLKHTITDIECLADDESKERTVLQRTGAGSRSSTTSRLQQRARGNGLNLGMDCNKITRETTETFVDAHDHYEMLEQLGRGSVATVRKAIRKKDGLVVSLKISGSKDKSTLVEAEFKMLQSIKHPHIIRAFDYFETSVSSILVLEYFEGNSLEDAVRQSSQGHFPELTARALFRSLLSAVCYLHSHRILHRDVKPSNVMVSVDLSDLRLLDFNVAKRLTEGGALTVTGTRLYFAPEVINGEPPSEANDVWGCGICLFYMLAGRLPWKNLPEGVFVDHPELKVIGSWCEGLSEPCKSVIRQCLTVESHWRPPVRAIMLHEWFWTDGDDPCSDADVNPDIKMMPRSNSRRATL